MKVSQSGMAEIEAYGFHALETLQCMNKQHKGGETGVRAVTCLEGADVWQAASEARWSRKLLDAVTKCVDEKARRSRTVTNRNYF